jgi:hypothetical protein
MNFYTLINNKTACLFLICPHFGESGLRKHYCRVPALPLGSRYGRARELKACLGQKVVAVFLFMR